MTKDPKRPRDPNQLAKFIVDMAVVEVQSAPAPEADSKILGRMGGLKGGKARAAILCRERRAEIAKAAAAARWRKRDDN